MNRTEAQSLIGVLNRAGLVGAMEGQSAVWADALDDIAWDDAVTVARELIRERTSEARWVVPGDIRSGVRRVRRARLEQGTNAEGVPDADPDNPVAYIDALRARRQRIADGESDRPVAALIDQAARTTRIPRRADV